MARLGGVAARCGGNGADPKAVAGCASWRQDGPLYGAKAQARLRPSDVRRRSVRRVPRL